MQENVITGKKIYKVYKLGDERVFALNGVSLEVKKGETVGIIGTNGTGSKCAGT